MRTHRSCARRVRQCGTRPHLHPQTDIRMPRRQLLALEDAHLHSRFCEAIAAAVGAIEARDMDCRVLNLGAGAGLHAAAALRAGAVHVTAVERWLYLALACKEVLAANQVRRGGRGVGQVRGGRGRPSHVTRRAAPAFFALSSLTTSTPWCTSVPPTSRCGATSPSAATCCWPTCLMRVRQAARLTIPQRLHSAS